MRKRLLAQAGVDNTGEPQGVWSEQFVALMRNRIAVGRLRYRGAPATPCGRYLEAMCKCINRYTSDGNTEHLVDAANYCMLEFQISPTEAFKPIDR